MGWKRWRRGFVAGILLVAPVSGLWAQSVADDIQQLLLDVEKLSQLKQILTQTYQEYKVLQQGYEKIKGLSEGTFSLHKAFLDGLLDVNPAVRSYNKVGDIIDKESNLLKGYQTASSQFRTNRLFTTEELEGFSANYGFFLQRGQKAVDELSMVMTDGGLRMSDAERLSAIDRIDRDMTRQLNLFHSFNNGISLLAAQRARAAGDIGTVKRLYGIGP